MKTLKCIFFNILIIFVFGCSTILLMAQTNATMAAKIGDLKITDQTGKSVTLTEDTLLKLAAHSIKTQTVWTEGTHLFEGVYLADLLKQAGVDVEQFKSDTVLRASALNDYEVDIPAGDAMKYKILVAVYMDGKRLTVQDKGPYWLVYPRDDYSEIQDSRVDQRWVWQLNEIMVK